MTREDLIKQLRGGSVLEYRSDFLGADWHDTYYTLDGQRAKLNHVQITCSLWLGDIVVESETPSDPKYSDKVIRYILNPEKNWDSYIL